MSILDRILLLLGNTDQKELTDYLGLKKTAFSDWKSGKSNSYRKYLIEIAKYFDVSLDYLVYGDESKFGLPNDQKDLLTLYNRLSPDYKSKIIERAETLAELEAERVAEQEKKEAVPRADELPAPEESTVQTQEDPIKITYFDYPASAGTGLFLDEAKSEEITVLNTFEAQNADYAIPVRGDSMEDEFHDGDIVLVESCPCVRKGEVGIFLLDGDVFIKEYGGDCLISYNEKYEPILLRKYEFAACLGKVLGIAQQMIK